MLDYLFFLSFLFVHFASCFDGNTEESLIQQVVNCGVNCGGAGTAWNNEYNTYTTPPIIYDPPVAMYPPIIPPLLPPRPPIYYPPSDMPQSPHPHVYMYGPPTVYSFMDSNLHYPSLRSISYTNVEPAQSHIPMYSTNYYNRRFRPKYLNNNRRRSYNRFAPSVESISERSSSSNPSNPAISEISTNKNISSPIIETNENEIEIEHLKQKEKEISSSSSEKSEHEIIPSIENFEENQKLPAKEESQSPMVRQNESFNERKIDDNYMIEEIDSDNDYGFEKVNGKETTPSDHSDDSYELVEKNELN